MNSINFKRLRFGRNRINIRQNHSCEILPRLMVETHYYKFPIAEITISWLFWEIKYSYYDVPLDYNCTKPRL